IFIQFLRRRNLLVLMQHFSCVSPLQDRAIALPKEWRRCYSKIWVMRYAGANTSYKSDRPSER
ncbi:MAG: hypothetical protein RMZ41_024405, partial [Nostoc sp. DedVER02]|uniref:hypothetical protein n=1 Tax=Nostoc sp. DedVER02 TaxID=3075405 RepID=UPI00391C7665